MYLVFFLTLCCCSDKDTDLIIEQIRKEAQQTSSFYQKASMEQARQLTDVQRTLEKMEKVLDGLEVRGFIY